MNSLGSTNEYFDEFNVRNNFAKRVRSNSFDEVSKKAALIDNKGETVVFKVPGKGSKQETLLREEFFMMPVSTCYVKTCYMALYLKKLSVISPNEYKDLLEIFNDSVLKKPRLYALMQYMSLNLDIIEDKFPEYVEHLINSDEECSRIQSLNELSPKQLPKNVQIYDYVHNGVGIQMNKKTFPDPSKMKFRVLATPFFDNNGRMVHVFYSVVIKNKSI